jgi:hypothetical protein
MALIKLEHEEDRQNIRRALQRLGAASAAALDAVNKIVKVPDAAVPAVRDAVPTATILTLGVLPSAPSGKRVSGSFPIGARHREEAVTIIGALGGTSSTFPSQHGTFHACFTIDEKAIGQLVEALSRAKFAAFSRASRIVFDESTPEAPRRAKKEISRQEKSKKEQRRINLHRAHG